MTVEAATYLNDFVQANPAGTDFKNEGDNHIRLIKQVLQNTFPNLTRRAFSFLAKGVNYNLVAGDNITVVNITAGGLTIGAAAAASLGSGHISMIMTDATHTCVFDPNAAELVNGAATYTCPAASVTILFCDGTQWFATSILWTGVTPGTAAGNVPVLDANGWLSQLFYQEPVVSRAANTMLVAADKGTQFLATTTFTQTLDAAATLKAGWFVDYKNDGTGIITFDPNGLELINGATTLRIYPKESCRIICTGTAFVVTGLSTGEIVIDKQSAANVASLVFVQGINADFHKFRLSGNNVVPTTNDSSLFMRMSDDGGATYKSGASDYAYTDSLSQAGSLTGGVISGSQFGVRCPATNASVDGGWSGDFYIGELSSTTHYKIVEWRGFAQRSATGPAEILGGGRFVNSLNAVNAIQLSFTSNMVTGDFILYGTRR